MKKQPIIMHAKHHHHHDDHDDSPAKKAQPGCHCGCSFLSIPLKADLDETASNTAEVWHIPNMDCPIEEREIKEALKEVKGIISLSFQLTSRTMTICAPDEVKKAALAAIKKAGYHPKALAPAEKKEAVSSRLFAFLRPAAALFLALSSEILHAFLPPALWLNLLTLGLSLSAILLVGISIYFNGLRSLFKGNINISALMAVAVTGAVILGQWTEAAMVMVLYFIAELIEARSIDRARNAIGQLLNLTPDITERRTKDGHLEEVSVNEVKPGDIIRIRPGAAIALDGTVLSGASAVNQMPITGESVSVTKMPGDPVYAGSINESGMLELTVTAPASETMIARIIAIVEKAQKAKAPIQRLVDRFAAIYTPAVFFIAVLAAVLLPFVAALSWEEAIYRALVLLVISCPCAFVIATPITVVSGLTSAAKAGILIKGGVYLEEARKIKGVAFDKTGTITKGVPKLVSVKPLSKTLTTENVYHLASAISACSSHPVSHAICEGTFSPGKLIAVTHFTEHPGKGIEGTIDKTRYFLGKASWILSLGLDLPELSSLLKEEEKAGHTVTLFASDKEILALFAVSDVIRAHSKEAIKALADHNVMPVMLTGDNVLTAKAIAKEAGIVHFKGDLFPEDKQAFIRDFKEKKGYVAMVGDGINDAPALVAADIGIAMGETGTGIAMETADVVMMHDDLRRVYDLIHLSRVTFNRLKENIVIAIGIKLAFFAMALFGYADMWMAVFADVGATLIVVFNGLRLLRWKSVFKTASH